MKIVPRYIYKFLKLWLFWFWAPALDLLAFFVDPYIQGFSFPKEVYWAIPLVGFVVANMKLFADCENCINELKVSIKNALQLATHEIEKNNAIASHNAKSTGRARDLKKRPFMQLYDDSFREVFLSGRFSFSEPLLTAVDKYLLTVTRINTLIDNLNRTEISDYRHQTVGAMARDVVRYCSGCTNAADDCTKSLPEMSDDLQKLIQAETIHCTGSASK